MSRNPLVRFSDRIEAIAMLLVLTALFLAVPFVGAFGTAMYDSRADTFAADRLSLHTVHATATQDSAMAGWPCDQPFRTTVQWQFDGTVHTDEWRSSTWMKAGDKQEIWIDDNGNHASAPRSDQDAATQAIVAAFGLWFALAGAGAVVWALLRIRLDRSRHAAWDRELSELADDHGKKNRNI
jgi:hypothetical protein